MTADPTQLALLGQRFKKCLKLPLEKDGQPEPETSQIKDFFKLLRNIGETRVWRLNNIGQIYNPELVTSGLKLGHELGMNCITWLESSM